MEPFASPESEANEAVVQGYLAYKKQATPLGLPHGPRLSPTVGSKGTVVADERGNPVVQP